MPRLFPRGRRQLVSSRRYHPRKHRRWRHSAVDRPVQLVSGSVAPRAFGRELSLQHSIILHLWRQARLVILLAMRTRNIRWHATCTLFQGIDYLFKSTRAKRSTTVDSTSLLLLRSTKTWKFDKIAAVPFMYSSTSKLCKSYRCLHSFFHSISRNHRIVSSRTRCSRLCYIPIGLPAVAQRTKRNKRMPCIIESQITALLVALRCITGGYP